MKKYPVSIRLACLLFLLVFLLSCGLFTPKEAPTPDQTPVQLNPPTAQPLQPTRAPATRVPPTQPAVAPAVETPAPEVTVQLPIPLHTPIGEALAPGGPWLLISASSGLWAVNEDGSGLTRLTQQPIVAPSTLARAVSPDGRSVAFISGDEDRLHNLTLNLLTLPGGEVKQITRLTSAATEPGADAVMLDNKVEAVRAVTDVNSLAWSPDGTVLAFIGVQQGATADLYTYSTLTGKIAQLTDGPAQAYGPEWSPDGKYIIQFGVTTFGTGAGYSMAGAWAARADNSGVVDLYKPQGSGEEFVGWLDNDTFVVSSWTPVCGPQSLRAVTIGVKDQSYLVGGCFTGAAMTGSGNLIITGAEEMGSELSGVYTVSPEDTARRPLSDAPAYGVTSLPESGEFTVDTRDGTQVYANSGELMGVPPAGIQCKYGMQLGSFGMIYAWTCGADNQPGVWINGPGLEERQVFDRPAFAPTMSWNNVLLFFSGSDLYRAFFLDYRPEKIAALPGDVFTTTWVRK